MIVPMPFHQGKITDFLCHSARLKINLLTKTDILTKISILSKTPEILKNILFSIKMLKAW